MTNVSKRPATVVLKTGLVVSASALQTLWGLEGRGCRIRVDEDGTLVIGPRSALSDADRSEIKANRTDLLSLVHYVDEVVT